MDPTQLQAAANWSQVIGVGLGAAAVLIAYKQLRGVRREVKDAVSLLSRRVHWRSVESLPLQMHKRQEDLDQACREDNSTGASQAFRDWAKLARRAAGILGALDDDAAREIRDQLVNAAERCEIAKSSVFEAGGFAREDVRRAITTVATCTGSFEQSVATEQARMITTEQG